MPLSKLVSAASGKSQFLALASTSSPYANVYSWDSATGFGTKYANPTTLPTDYGSSVCFSPDGYSVIFAMNSYPGLAAYAWNVNGFGTKYADPGTAPTVVLSVTFSPAGDAVAVGTTASLSFSAWPWSRSSGFGTKYSDPSSSLSGIANSVAFNPAGNAIVVGGAGDCLAAWAWSSAGFGSRYSTPAFNKIVNSVKFTPAGNAVVAAHDTTPYIAAWPWSGSGFGTKYSDPSLLPANNGYSISVTSAGDYVGIQDTSSNIDVYPWSYASGFGTRVRNSTLASGKTANELSFSPGDDAIAVAVTSSPYVVATRWSSGSFRSAYSNPSTLASSGGASLAFGKIG